ncbi:glycine dehydrogenase, partial [bacterium 210820-DFI.6.52]|nr:glycine dehydrogenase [bacterium 210820-DFI.6.52]
LNSGKNKNKILVAKSINPEIMEVIKTYMKFKDIEVIEIDYDRKTGRVDVDSLKANIDKESACMLVQSPNFFGII